jgi:hypothetical protein
MGATVTFRDAGVHSRLLRGLNRAGGALARLGIRLPSLSTAGLLHAARRRTGLTKFANPGIHEDVDVLCRSLAEEGGLTTFGRIALRSLLVQALACRLELLDWVEHYPEVRDERIERPWIIVGLPRTGTTLLSVLLGLDPSVRPLLQWEASHPVPPPDLATRAEDPRIAETAGMLRQLERINPAILAMHPIGATLPTECVTLFILDLRALSIETQAPAPSYGAWLEDADMTQAYALHRLALQVLQSRVPTQTWSLKSPQHLWHLDALHTAYPDARVIWTHRDPAKVVPSVASLVTALRRANCTRVDPVATGEEWTRKLQLAVTRGIDFDERQTGRKWCQHLHYETLMADPVAAVRRLYAEHDEELHPLHVRRMETWLRERPQTAFGRHVYAPADFGMNAGAIDERFRDYREHYDVPRESSA